MRDLEKNKRLIHYSTYTTTPLLDDGGNETGEFTLTYGEIFPLKINVSPPSGKVLNRAFGKIIDCNRVLFTFRKDLPIDQKTVFWIDTDTDNPHDYEIAGISDGLNTMVYAVKKVNVS